MRRHLDHIPIDRHLLPLATIICAATLTAMDVPTSNYCLAFSIITPLAYRPPQFKTRQTSFLPKHQPASWNPFSVQLKTTSLHASPSSSNKTKPPPLPKIDDPYLLLGLDSRNPTTDKKDIKRAYRKRAMQYHPDVILGVDSTKEERNVASKDFARINAAYEMLTGGGKGSVGSSSTSGSGAKSSSGGYKYQPPHRRTSDYNSGKSTNWEDFMPKYDEEDAKYDADGDSIGSIFSDILTGAAGYASGVAGTSGGSGIVGDFIDFLEGNIDGFESGYDDDTLLRYGSFDEVASDMDETDILVTSLETKLSTVENELMQAQADLNLATKFSEKLDFEERVAELKAREKVVKGYLKKGKKRLIKLRERYKELMVEGRGGRGYGGSSSRASASGSSRSSAGGSSSSSRSNSSSRAPEPAASSAPSTASSTSSTPSSAPASSSTKSWRNEGFSSSYGGRSPGSTRSSRRNRGAANVDEPSTAPTTKEQPNQQQQRPDENAYSSRSGGSNRSSTNPASKTTTSRSSNKPVPLEYEPWVPPHRRTKSSSEQAAQDKKRLRELKVDDDFDRLKREMGM